jgi:hypothetical protein
MKREEEIGEREETVRREREDREGRRKRHRTRV